MTLFLIEECGWQRQPVRPRSTHQFSLVRGLGEVLSDLDTTRRTMLISRTIEDMFASIRYLIWQWLSSPEIEWRTLSHHVWTGWTEIHGRTSYGPVGEIVQWCNLGGIEIKSGPALRDQRWSWVEDQILSISDLCCPPSTGWSSSLSNCFPPFYLDNIKIWNCFSFSIIVQYFFSNLLGKCVVCKNVKKEGGLSVIQVEISITSKFVKIVR